MLQAVLLLLRMSRPAARFLSLSEMHPWISVPWQDECSGQLPFQDRAHHQGEQQL